jgi:hypothetical protein
MFVPRPWRAQADLINVGHLRSPDSAAVVGSILQFAFRISRLPGLQAEQAYSFIPPWLHGWLPFNGETLFGGTITGGFRLYPLTLFTRCR